MVGDHLLRRVQKIAVNQGEGKGESNTALTRRMAEELTDADTSELMQVEVFFCGSLPPQPLSFGCFALRGPRVQKARFLWLLCAGRARLVPKPRERRLGLLKFISVASQKRLECQV